MGMELVDLQKAIAAALASDPLAELVTKVAVQADSDEFGSEFLRVLVNLKPSDHDQMEELSELISRIEDAVAQVDNRYPSVRFLDAA